MELTIRLYMGTYGASDRADMWANDMETGMKGCFEADRTLSRGSMELYGLG